MLEDRTSGRSPSSIENEFHKEGSDENLHKTVWELDLDTSRISRRLELTYMKGKKPSINDDAIGNSYIWSTIKKKS